MNYFFISGINVGLSISDILKFKIEDLVKSNCKTVREYVIIAEKLTGKTKKFYIGDTVKKVIENYIKEVPNFDMHNHVFQIRNGKISLALWVSTPSRKDKNKKTVWKFMICAIRYCNKI